MVAAMEQTAGTVLAVDPWVLESPAKAAPEAPLMGVSLGGEPSGVGMGRVQERHPHCRRQGLSNP